MKVIGEETASPSYGNTSITAGVGQAKPNLPQPGQLFWAVADQEEEYWDLILLLRLDQAVQRGVHVERSAVAENPKTAPSRIGTACAPVEGGQRPISITAVVVVLGRKSGDRQEVLHCKTNDNATSLEIALPSIVQCLECGWELEVRQMMAQNVTFGVTNRG